MSAYKKAENKIMRSKSNEAYLPDIFNEEAEAYKKAANCRFFIFTFTLFFQLRNIFFRGRLCF